MLVLIGKVVAPRGHADKPGAKRCQRTVRFLTALEALLPAALPQRVGDVRRLNVKLSRGRPAPAYTLDNEALFQLPLLAMSILAISKGLSKPQLPEIGQLVGECLERTVAGFKGSYY